MPRSDGSSRLSSPGCAPLPESRAHSRRFPPASWVRYIPIAEIVIDGSAADDRMILSIRLTPVPVRTVSDAYRPIPPVCPRRVRQGVAPHRCADRTRIHCESRHNVRRWHGSQWPTVSSAGISPGWVSTGKERIVHVLDSPSVQLIRAQLGAALIHRAQAVGRGVGIIAFARGARAGNRCRCRTTEAAEDRHLSDPGLAGSRASRPARVTVRLPMHLIRLFGAQCALCQGFGCHECAQTGLR